jgi:hypothetical protein
MRCLTEPFWRHFLNLIFLSAGDARKHLNISRKHSTQSSKSNDTLSLKIERREHSLGEIQQGNIQYRQIFIEIELFF